MIGEFETLDVRVSEMGFEMLEYKRYQRLAAEI